MGDEETLTSKGVSSACPYHDTPMVDDGSAAPFWASPDNLARAEFLRLLCLEYSVFDDNAGNVVSNLVTHECQRYMSATAFGYVSLDQVECPPADDDACDSGEGDDGFWHCSGNVARGLYKCPGGAETMVFCPGDADVCSKPHDPVRIDSDEDPRERMCCTNCGGNSMRKPRHPDPPHDPNRPPPPPKRNPG